MITSGIRLLSATCVLALVFGSGCATHIRKASSAPQPPKVRFSEFKAFSMKQVTIAPDFAAAPANQKAARKIDEELFKKMQIVFPSLTLAAKQATGDAKSDRTLLIEPTIIEIKFIGGAARFWLGAMAGSSAVLMKATFKDSTTGEVIAEPEFYQVASAMSGGWSVGATDNRMLTEIAQQICNYAALGK